MEAKTKAAPNISAALFWDTKMENINWNTNAPYVVERVLSRGAWADFKTLLAFYGKERIRNEALNLRYLDKRTLAFCASYFNIPIEKFRCYTTQQSNPGHWSY